LKKEVAVERKQDTLEKSQARVQKLLELLKKSQERERQRCSRSKPRKKLLTPEQRGRRQRKYQRKYNRSPAGRARYRKWQESPQGRDARTRAYQERREWLDQVKERGCVICGEKNPLVLRFRLQDGKKAKFSPHLQNISRSKPDWLKVLKVCDVLCVRCLVLMKHGRKPLGDKALKVKVSEGLEMLRHPIVNDRENVHGGLLRPDTSNHTCKTCGAEFKPKSKAGPRKREFCSDSCRLLYWAGKRLLEVARAGQGSGLQKIITELVEVRQ